LVGRVASKAGLGEKEVKALKEKKDGSGLVYEYEGGKWSLEDGMLFERPFPPSRLDSPKSLAR
jgi:hypothetical protein